MICLKLQNLFFSQKEIILHDANYHLCY